MMPQYTNVTVVQQTKATIIAVKIQKLSEPFLNSHDHPSLIGQALDTLSEVA